MEIVTSWMEEGIERGIQRETDLVVRILNRRLSSLSSQREQEIRQLNIDDIEALGEALLDFETEADLIAWLAETKAKLSDRASQNGEEI